MVGAECGGCRDCAQCYRSWDVPYSQPDRFSHGQKHYQTIRPLACGDGVFRKLFSPSKIGLQHWINSISSFLNFIRN